MKTTRTLARLHFDDLDPARFEDLSLSMVYRLNRWASINHYGKSGADDGVDIYAIEELENGKRRTWFIQCKRYSKLNLSELKGITDKALAKNSVVPDILLVIVSCDISKKNIESFVTYAKGKGIPNPQVWTESVIEARLYAEHHDLLFAYFGVNLNFEKRSKIASVKRNIKMKYRMKEDFIRKKFDPSETIKRPYEKFSKSESIIHSIDDTAYPKSDENSIGISSWFKVELYNFYFNGLEVIIGGEECIFNEDGKWDIVEYTDTLRKEKYRTERVFVIGRIPYDNIIDYDFYGDDYYGCPHIYCDFKNAGMPYEEIVYSIMSSSEDKGYSYEMRLDNEDRKELV